VALCAEFESEFQRQFLVGLMVDGISSTCSKILCVSWISIRLFMYVPIEICEAVPFPFYQ